MKHLVALMAAAMLSAPALADHHTEGEAKEAVMAMKAEVGKPAPDFTGTTATGDTLTLSDHKGSIVVLEWTNHGCPFVKKHYSSGNMQSLQKAATADGVKWIRVISSAEGKQGHLSGEEALEMAEEQGAVPTATLLDASGDIGHLYDAKTTPHMYVIDQKGILQYAGAIDDNPSADPADIEGAKNYVTEALAAVKEGKTPATQFTKAYGCSVKY